MLPGGLGVSTFYKRLRVKGFKVTKDETKKLITTWKEAFPEMKQHYTADLVSEDDIQKYGSVIYKENDETAIVAASDESESGDDDRFSYYCETLTGRKRNRCSYCSALNGRFQGFSADVIKYALWNLYEAGFGPLIVNEVHDEADLIIPLNKVRELVPVVENIMFQSAQVMLPDIRVSGETTVSIYWDKGGTPFNELEYDDNGVPILDIPDYIKALKAKQIC